MDVGFPTNVCHITHVTFDRLQGFLGLPTEFELDVPRSVPSASVSVFGVSVESMQCSKDARGNSVPSILLLLQEKLYAQDGLTTEGIFRVNPDNFEEGQLREHINKGIIPDNIDTHCLAGLIKAWFRELPKGVLDSLSPEQVMKCHTEDECNLLIKALPPTESALFDWAINLMADVVHEEAHNKMNARNVAVVFAPNMSQMLDPLTALKHAVQVMNLLKILILKTLRDRQKSALATDSIIPEEPLEGANAKQHDCPTLVQPDDTQEGTLLEKSSLENSFNETQERTHIENSCPGNVFESAEMYNKMLVGGTRSSLIASAISEIVEEIASANGSQQSYSSASSRRGSGDECDGAFSCQGRFSDQSTWSSFGGEGHKFDLVKDNCRQSRPLACWLQMGLLPTVKSTDDLVVFDDGPCPDSHLALTNCSSPLHDSHFGNCHGNAGSWNVEEPLADGLHCESSPNIILQLLKEAKISDKEEKSKIKLPTAVKSALLNCHARMAYPLSRRTHYLKSGTV